MIERLKHALEHLEDLPPELQEELAEQIEEMVEPAQEDSGADSGIENALLARRMRVALGAIGSWRALQDDDEFEALDRIRHQSRPTPPVEDELGDL
jgi:hypothetical protein